VTTSHPFASPLSLPFDVWIQLEGLGERCKLPQRGMGQSPSRNRIWWQDITDN